ncbi:hypothetical protein GQ568_02705, partial [Patescibacteria group bacterium]|nr:hypothetical protein [Patescibacteria group bacterium]
MSNDKEIKLKNLLDKERNINKIGSEIKEAKKEMLNFNNKLDNKIKDSYTEELEISKFIMEHDLKNIDVILDILKVTTSLSISLFIASLTTPYFNEKVGIIILLNFILIILLIIFIEKRKSILLKWKGILLGIFKESSNITRDNINFQHSEINKELEQ